jgi:hypothetical protein
VGWLLRAARRTGRRSAGQDRVKLRTAVTEQLNRTPGIPIPGDRVLDGPAIPHRGRCGRLRGLRADACSAGKLLVKSRTRRFRGTSANLAPRSTTLRERLVCGMIARSAETLRSRGTLRCNRLKLRTDRGPKVHSAALLTRVVKLFSRSYLASISGSSNLTVASGS